MSQLSDLIKEKKMDVRRVANRIIAACRGDGYVVTSVGVRHVDSGIEFYGATVGERVRYCVKKKDALISQDYDKLSTGLDCFAENIIAFEEKE